jgi:hypothetical protein
MSQLNPTDIVTATSDQVSSLLGDEVVILNLTTGVYHGVEGVAAFVWQLLSKPTTVAELVEAIIKEYDVDADRCRADLAALLADMAKNGLVQISNATAA